MEPITAPTPSAGWYPDPWRVAAWRWWDGRNWTGHVSGEPADDATGRPRLPAWLSVPVVIAIVPVSVVLVLMTIRSPLTTVLGMVPLLIVGPTMRWLDRVEPEPNSALLHAFLWGATVAVLVASLVNIGVILVFGEIVGSVISAPLIEEAMKGLGVWWAAKRLQVDGIMDGIVYAGWVGIGFAVVEDITYFVDAKEGGALAATFTLRALLGPFAHPLFTAWTGLAIGRAVARQGDVKRAGRIGYVGAVLAHFLWNGSLVAAVSWQDSGALVIGIAILVFVTLFSTFAVVLYKARLSQERRFLQLVPWLAERYRLDPEEIRPFTDATSGLAARRSVPRRDRRQFDEVRAALARLALLHDRPSGADAATEARLVQQLQRARRQD
ncbi:MAG: PrsW family glutamic-type intramembrane protease [Ilumatobacteraceae bacterium]